jgi:hypothetical protein
MRISRPGPLTQLVSLTLALGCAPTVSLGAQDWLVPAGVVLDGPEARALLAPCTRPGPDPVDSLWQPTAEQITAFEAALPAAAKAKSWSRPGWGPDRPLNRFRGQYAGFVRAGQRLIYGSFTDTALVRSFGADMFEHRAVRWCDAKGRTFGAVFDPSSGLIADLVGGEAGLVEVNRSEAAS